MQTKFSSTSLVINGICFNITFTDQERLIKIEAPFEAVVDYVDPDNLLIFFGADTSEQEEFIRRQQIGSLVANLLQGS